MMISIYDLNDFIKLDEINYLNVESIFNTINLSNEQNLLKIFKMTNLRTIFITTTQELFDKYKNKFAIFQCIIDRHVYDASHCELYFPKILIHEDKMSIMSINIESLLLYQLKLQDYTNIKYIHISPWMNNHNVDSIINNLGEIECLTVGCYYYLIKDIKFNNLPVTLIKLIFIVKHFDKVIDISFIENNVKLPYGCTLEIIQS